jgi:regulator of sigma D
MENWRFLKEVLAVAAIMATVFLAYSDVTSANAVQDSRIGEHDRALVVIKDDLVRRLDRIEDQIIEIRKNTERK